MRKLGVSSCLTNINEYGMRKTEVYMLVQKFAKINISQKLDFDFKIQFAPKQVNDKIRFFYQKTF